MTQLQESGGDEIERDEEVGPYWCARCAEYRVAPICPVCGSETDLT